MTRREACDPEIRVQMYHEASRRNSEWRVDYRAEIQSSGHLAGIQWRESMTKYRCIMRHLHNNIYYNIQLKNMYCGAPGVKKYVLWR